jgi:serine/threonine-protein kinase HipA
VREHPTEVIRADVHKAGRLAAHLTRTHDGVEFAYVADWVRNGGPPVATTLPVGTDIVRTTGGAVPAFFAGLLPEGRRLSALRRAVKTSADDDLSLLLAVGSDPVGDVQVVPEGAPPTRAGAYITKELDQVRFADVLASFEIAVDRAALAGVQEKASLAMINLPVTTGGSSAILKLDPPEYPHLVENEAFFLGASRRSRIATVTATVVTDADGRAGLVVRRFDRRPTADGRLDALAVEDGCQVRGRYPAAKYLGGLEETLGALAAVCAAPRPAALELLRQAVFAYLSGNGDAHAKNFSVLADDQGRFAPAPAYDLPSSYPYGDATLALSVDGRRDGNLTGARFLSLGRSLGLPERAARRAVRETAQAADGWIEEVAELPFDTGITRKLRRVIQHRQRLLLEDQA